MLNLLYEYAIKFENNLYYTGRVNSNENPNYLQGKKHQAFTYTESSAYRLIERKFYFKNCTVEKII